MTDFIILVDALRHDYVTPDRMPFLHALSQQGVCANVIETYAFQTRPAYLAGLEPEQSDICNLYEFSPGASPFKFLRPILPLVKLFDGTVFDGVVRSMIRRIAKRIEHARGNHASADVMSTSEIPLGLLPYFSLCERAYTDSPGAYGIHDTIFDLFRDSNRSWRWIGYPRHYGSSAEILAQYRAASAADVYYLHFSELDWVGHRYGPNGSEMVDACRAMDSTLKEVLSAPLEKGGRAIVFGDHGMVEVEYTLDIQEVLAHQSVRPGIDYVPFIDSTQARFWFMNEEARSVVVSALKEIKGGHWVTREERSSLKINFGHDRFGEELFILDGPGIIHPSFFARRTPPRGMHGYPPQVRDNMARVVAVGGGAGDLGTIPMVKIFTLAKKTFGYPSTTPYGSTSQGVGPLGS